MKHCESGRVKTLAPMTLQKDYNDGNRGLTSCDRTSEAGQNQPGTRVIGAVPPSPPEDIGNPDFCSVFGSIHTYGNEGGTRPYTFFSPSHHPSALSGKCVGHRASPGVGRGTLSSVVPARPHPPIHLTMNRSHPSLITPASLASSRMQPSLARS